MSLISAISIHKVGEIEQIEEIAVIVLLKVYFSENFTILFLKIEKHQSILFGSFDDLNLLRLL